MIKTYEPLPVNGLLTSSGGALNLEQYLSLWAIEETFFNQQWDMIRSMNLQAHVATAKARSSANVVEPDGSGILQIEVRGTMTKQGSSLSDAGSTVRIKQAMRDARRSADVGGVMVITDTPGGTVAGTDELAEEYWMLSQEKPTITFVEDMMASAGLYFGSQGRKVYANVGNAIVGSMGVFIGLYDLSGLAAKEGIKPVVIKTGDLKGSGFAGTEITQEQKNMWQALADESFVSFQAALNRSRKISAEQMKEISKAGVYPAKQAIGLGLIDGIRSHEQAMAELRTMIPSRRKGAKMSESNQPQAQAATLDQLESACKGAKPEFLLGQLRLGATVALAQSAWMGVLSATNADLQSQLTAGETALAKLKADHATEIAGLNTKIAALEEQVKAKGGFAPTIEAGGKPGSGEGSAASRWNAAVEAAVKGGMSRPEAVQHVAAKQPELREAYVEEANAARK